MSTNFEMTSGFNRIEWSTVGLQVYKNRLAMCKELIWSYWIIEIWRDWRYHQIVSKFAENTVTYHGKNKTKFRCTEYLLYDL